jgi:hypothetical protein
LAAVSGTLRDWALGGAGAGAGGPQELARLFAVVRGRGACRHPDGALRLIASALEVFSEEFADHARHGPCDACDAPPALPLPHRSGSRLTGATA